MMARYFEPGAVDPVAEGVPPDQVPGIAQQWGTMLSDPALGAGLLSGALSLMAGPTWGDTGMSQVARAIGRAGEGVTASGEIARRERESEAKTDLAEARAAAAGTSAGRAADRAYYERQALGLKREAEEGRTERAQLQARVKGSIEYGKYLENVKKRNASVLREGPPEVPIPKAEWLQRNGYPVGDVGPGASSVPRNNTRPTTGTLERAPPDRASRVPNRVYQTDRGPMRWTGTGWVDPAGDDDED
jgi:hypothetical protein